MYAPIAALFTIGKHGNNVSIHVDEENMAYTYEILYIQL